MQEAGFAGFQYVTQALSLRLDGFLTTPLTPAERTAIIVALEIPSDRPALVFSCGAPATGVKEAERQPDGPVAVAVSGGRPPVHVEYSLGGFCPAAGWLSTTWPEDRSASSHWRRRPAACTVLTGTARLNPGGRYPLVSTLAGWRLPVW